MAEVVKCYGPPGTGKTFRAVRWIVQQVLAGADPTGVAFVSFTNAACDEARRRVIAGLREAGVDVYEWEMTYCATLHALCKRSLRIEGEWLADFKWLKEFAAGYGYALQSRRGKSDSEDLDTVAQAGGEDAPLLAVWDFGRNRLITDPDQAYRAYLAYDPDGGYRVPYDRFLAFVRDYESAKQMSFRRDMTDLLLEVVRHPRPLPVSVLAIDEAQDMTPLLWAAADALFSGAPAAAYLADDDQCIYSYSGADPSLFNDRPATDVRLLTQSYRLPSRIADLAARIIRQNRNRVDKQVLPRLDGAAGDAQRVDDLSALDLDNGESWMILVRNWAFVADLAGELESSGVPYRIQGEAQYCPWSDKGPFRAARLIHQLSTPGTTVRLQDLEPLVDKTRVETKSRPGAWQYGVKSRLLGLIQAEPAAAVSLIDLPRLGLTQWGFDQIATRRLELLADDVSARDLDAYSAAMRSGAWDRLMAGKPIDVLVSTIHGVKGQEAQNVACLMACTPAPARNLEREDRREEEVRLAYVGVTRAKERFFGVDGSWLSFGQPYELFGV